MFHLYQIFNSEYFNLIIVGNGYKLILFSAIKIEYSVVVFLKKP